VGIYSEFSIEVSSSLAVLEIVIDPNGVDAT
jgi:hypothetical protein